MGRIRQKSIREDEDNLEDRDENSEIKSLKINSSKWRFLCQRHLQHHCIVECPVSNSDQAENFHIKFQKTFLQDPQHSKALFTSNPCTVGLPYPVLLPNEISFEEDPCIKLVKEKDKYKRDLIYYRNIHKRYKGRTDFIKDSKFCTLPRYIVDIAKGALKDPDPFFEGLYDWYYTGGILDNVKIGNRELLVIVKPQQNLSIIDPYETDNNFIVNYDTECENVTPIYALKTYHYENGFLFLLRAKHNLFLRHSVFKDGDFMTNKLWSTKSSLTPYIDFKMNISKDEIATVDVSHTLSIINLQTSKNLSNFILSNSLEGITKSLSQVEYLQDNSILFMDWKSIYTLDLNSGSHQQCVLESNVLMCDDLCCIVKSKANKNYVYVATKHNILKVDLRRQKVAKKWSYSNKWSHMMSTPPIAAKSLLYNGNEWLYICGPNFADKVLLCVSQETDLPIYVPNINDTLNRTNLAGNITYSEDVNRRLKLCNAGISIMESNGGIELFTANSVGDLYQQRVLETTEGNLAKTERFIKWLDLVPKRERSLEVTGVCNMSKYFFSLVKDDADEHYLRKLRKPNKHIQKLKEDFNDIDLIDDPKFKAMDSIWMDDEEQRANELAVPVTPKLKVTEWLQSTNEPAEEISGIEYLSDL